MKRPVVLIVGAAAGALLVAAVGASAHTGFSLSRLVNLHSATFGDEATGARVEPTDSPEPTETPEAQATTEPAEAPEAADTDTDTDTDTDNETETNDDNEGGGGGGGHDD